MLTRPRRRTVVIAIAVVVAVAIAAVTLATVPHTPAPSPKAHTHTDQPTPPAPIPPAGQPADRDQPALTVLDEPHHSPHPTATPAATPTSTDAMPPTHDSHAHDGHAHPEPDPTVVAGTGPDSVVEQLAVDRLLADATGTGRELWPDLDAVPCCPDAVLTIDGVTTLTTPGADDVTVVIAWTADTTSRVTTTTWTPTATDSWDPT